MDIISRKEAFKQGLKTYYTGKPCKWGHIARRYLQNGNCKTCARHKSTLQRRKPKKKYAIDVSRLTMRLHMDDVAMVRELGNALNMARYGYTAPPCQEAINAGYKTPVYDGTARFGMPAATDEDIATTRGVILESAQIDLMKQAEKDNII
jgi:hypothetical protein